MAKKKKIKRRPKVGSKEYFADLGRKLAREYQKKPALWWLDRRYIDKDAMAHDMAVEEEWERVCQEYFEAVEK